jgi:DNA sulfur modification protein DndD
MYVKSISLENYRCHKKTEIDFFPGGSQGNLSIIEGGDGDGKTTLFNAIGWCLYGIETSELLGEPKQSLGIPNVSSLNNDGLSKLSVDLWLETGESAESKVRPTSIRAMRRASIRGTRIVEQEFSLQIYSQNENPKVLRDQEAKRYMESIAPRDLIEFYMFNGEYLSSGRNVKGENIDASIKRQFRTGSIRSMEELLRQIESDYRESANRASKKQDSGIASEIKQLGETISKDEARKESSEEDAKAYRDQEKAAREDMEKYREAKIKIESKKELLGELSKKQQKRREIIGNTKETLEKLLKTKTEYGYLVLSKATLGESYSKIKEEIGRGNLPPNIKKEFVDDLIEMHKCICGRDLPEGSIEIERVKAILNESERESSKNILLEISPVINGILQIVEDKVPKMLKSMEGLIKEQQEKERELSDEIEAMNSKESSLTEDEKMVIQEFENAEKDFNNFSTLASESEGRVKGLENKIRLANENLGRLKEKQEKLAGKADEAQGFFSYAKEAALLKEILAELRDKISEIFIISLQEEVNRLISSVKGLSHLSVSIKNIAGSVRVDYEDKFLPLEGVSYLSEGQNQIISIALIAAYSSVLKNLGSGIAEAPFIIMDHPFSDLGLPRKEEILRSFGTLFAGTKVIMLTPPGDFDFSPVGESIASHYKVKNDPEKKICSVEVPP